MAHRHIAPTLAAAGRELWQIVRDICDPYRPEQHYMRGPGPKWQAAHPARNVQAIGEVTDGVNSHA